MASFKKTVIAWLKDKKYDQCILEGKKNSDTEWVHISLYGQKGVQRCECFELEV